jgi:hypothetical protein
MIKGKRGCLMDYWILAIHERHDTDVLFKAIGAFETKEEAQAEFDKIRKSMPDKDTNFVMLVQELDVIEEK